ncbi:DUF6082 family protein [Dactylosporangium sp. CS-047395]|uniref:DUF6082 family protein n=1 Tax=Dactylosporangium sp. CS-047395 TaxID=3239936 RepID=UPI003D89D9A6
MDRRAAAALAVFLTAGVLILVGMGVGLPAPHGWDELSDAFSVVNGIFSALALIVVLVTVWIQFNELRMQRAELRMQREAAEQSRHELFRSSESVFRELHVHLLEMAINDEDLAEVWPESALTLIRCAASSSSTRTWSCRTFASGI